MKNHENNNIKTKKQLSVKLRVYGTKILLYSIANLLKELLLEIGASFFN